MEKDIYPIGQQDFKNIRVNNAIYVDKTPYIEKLVMSQSRYFFLARPRRFGKSLFLSTLRYFFEGERELFKGLYIDSTDWNWEKYPVLHIDLNSGEYSDPGNLDVTIDYLLSHWEKEYNIELIPGDATTRFHNIITNAHNKTGKQVIILVDEYDKPLIKNIDKEAFEDYQEKLAALYSNFKTCAPHIRMVFLTGVSRFCKLSVFSGLNNIKDITFSNEYADICGITDKDIPYYAKFQSATDAAKVKDFIKYIKLGKPDDFMKSLQTYFAGVSYMMKMDDENNFHNAFFLITNLIGIESEAGFMTSDGRIDMLIKTPLYIYIIELKYDKSAEEALEQINHKRYDLMFRDDKRKIFKIGVSFSSKTRTIEDWIIE